MDQRTNKYNTIHVGIIKENEDFQRMGRLGVLIPTLNTPDSIVNVIYASPFAGITNIEDNDKNDVESYDGTQKSYGFWAVPPDIGVAVLIAFINGDPSRGVWFSCLQSQDVNHMLPNLPVGESFEYGAGKAPVAEYNKHHTTEKVDGKKPHHIPHYTGVRKQGLKNDKKRGFSQHGARSDKPSRVMGMLSPKAHHWSIEDTDNDEKIRIRTRSGVQILLDETEGFIYMINKDGSGWGEITPEGKIMFYGSDIAMRSANDISMFADKRIIMEAGEEFFIKTQNLQFETKSSAFKAKDHLALEIDKRFSLRSETWDSEVRADTHMLGLGKVHIGSDDLHINSGGRFHLTCKDMFNVRSGGRMVLSGDEHASFSSKAGIVIAGNDNLVLKGKYITENMGGSPINADAAFPCRPETVTVADIPMNIKIDIEQPDSDDDAVETEIETIVPLYPTHEPCKDKNTYND